MITQYEEVEDILCLVCGEHWPATIEFFQEKKGSKRRFYSPCRACIAEQRKGNRNQQKKCAVQGCSNTRAYKTSHLCKEHLKEYHRERNKKRKIAMS